MFKKNLFAFRVFLIACISMLIGSDAVAQIATLPVSHDAGKSSLPIGFTAKGLGSDYANAPKLKFDSTGDCLILHFDGTPGTLTYDFKLNGDVNSSNVFTVETSVDGNTYSVLKKYTGSEINKSISTASFDLSSDVRYVKWTYTNKASGNVGLGAILLTAGVDADAVATPTITPATMFDGSQEVTITSEEGTTIWYTTDGVTVPAIGTGIHVESNTVTFTIDATTTVKAIATDGEKVSSVASATYILTETKKYYKVTSAEELVVGGRYLISNVASGEKAIVLSTTQNSNNRGQVEVSSAGEVITVFGEAVCELVLGKGNTTGTWAFYDETNSGYLYAASSSSNYLRTESSLSSNSSATITIDDSGIATIKFQGDNTRNWLQHNPSSKIFSSYLNAQEDVQLYRLAEFSIGADGYASFYTDKAFVMPEGVEGGIITAAEGGKLTIDYNYPAGATVPAKTGLLLKGVAGKYAYDVTTSEETAPTGNLLYGADAVDGEGKMYVDGADVKYYVLSKDEDGNNLGFYWMAADGAPVAYQAGKAFLAVDFGGEVKEFSMFSLDDASTTGIESTEAAKAGDGKIYTLTGVCVGNNLKVLPKGVYIVNGKKVAF